ncbi:MAG: hypothetical protein ACLFNW_00610 [Desulfobacterales bacterium]
MTDRRQELREELKRIEAELKDLNDRIPPHSVKPVFIQKLDELESRRDEIIRELELQSDA